MFHSILVSSLLLLGSASAAYSQDIEIYTQNIHTSQQQGLGVLSYSVDSHESSFTTFPGISIENGAFSICARDLSVQATNCFAYHEADGDFSGEFQIRLDSDSGHISGISFIHGTRASGLSSRVLSAPLAVQPNLKPFQNTAASKSAQAQTETKTVTRKRVVENEDGQKVVVEEEIEEVVEVEVDNRSWVQKNWMYIVPPLVLFLIFSPSDEK